MIIMIIYFSSARLITLLYLSSKTSNQRIESRYHCFQTSSALSSSSTTPSTSPTSVGARQHVGGILASPPFSQPTACLRVDTLIMMIHKKMMTAKKMMLKMYINHNDSALVGAPHRANEHQHPAYDHDYDYDLLMINHIMITMIFRNILTRCTSSGRWVNRVCKLNVAALASSLLALE